MTARVQLAFNEDLARRLPLPLAQLYRRAHNAKSSLERHQAAYYLWEAALKLLASVAIAEYAALGTHDPELTRRLENLARPSTGHWWEFIRRLVPVLADSGDTGFRAVRDLVLGATRADMPRAAGLEAALGEALQAGGGARSTVRLSELFDRLVQYRNRELGHGAAGQRGASFYDRMAPALLAGIAEVLGIVDPLAGRELMYLAEVRGQTDGSWLLERYALEGEAARRLETVELPSSAASRLPRPGCVYAVSGLVSGPELGAYRSLHPLVIYDADTGEVSFLSARRGERACEHLSYASGRVERRDNLRVDHRELLASVLGLAAGEDDVARWTEHGRAEDPPGEPVPASAAGRRIGEFELLSRMGRGGMGAVYRAWQPSLGRQVALKVLFGAGDPKVESRFAREIRALGRVEHPNLVKIFTSGSDGERWFYAMEVVEGADLARVCDQLAGSTASEVGASDWQRAVSSAYLEAREDEEPFRDGSDRPAPAAPLDGAPPAVQSPAARPGPSGAKIAADYLHQAVETVRQVAGAAHALHEAGIVHRDIKPGNIVLTSEGSHAVLMDLGLAQLADDEQGRLTRTRQFVGTLRYASPEQVLAAGNLDRRSDVYSLGATLWELVTLRPLFGAGDETPSHDLMLKIQSEDPVRVRKLNPRVDADLDAIVMKCMEKSPARRYGSAAELSDDLGRWQRGEPVRAQPQTAGYLLRKLARKHRGRLAAAGLLALALLGLAGFSVLRIHEAHRRSELALFDLHTSFGLQATEENDMAGALLWFAEAAGVPHGDPERERAALARLGSWYPEVAVPLRAFSFEGEVGELVFHPQGTHLLARGEGNRCALWDLHNGEPLPIPGGESEVALAAWNPPGDRLLLASSRGCGLFEFPGGGEVERFDGPSPTAIAFRPDGRLLALGERDVRLWDCDRRAFAAEPIPHPENVRWMSFSRDGSRLVTSAADNLARLYQIDSDGRARQVLEPVPHLVTYEIPGLLISRVPWSPVLTGDGQGLITVTTPTEVTLWDVKTRQRRHRIPVVRRLAAMVPSPDAERLAIMDFEGCQVWHLGTERMEGRKLYLTGVRPLAVWSPDGSALLSTGSDFRAIQWTFPARSRVNGFTQATAALPHTSPVRTLEYSPSGEHIATAEKGGLIRLWRPRDESGIRRLRFSIERAAWSPDGKHFATAPISHHRSYTRTRVCSLPDAEPVSPWIEPEGILDHVSFSPDGARLLTMSIPDGRRGETGLVVPPGAAVRIDFWDWRGGAALWRARLPAPALETEFTPDGKRLAVRCETGEIVVIDAGSGHVLSTIQSPVNGRVRLAPGAETFVTWIEGDRVRVRSTSTGAERVPGLEPPTEAMDLQFSSSSERLATASPEHVLRVWDLASGRPVSSSIVHPGRVLALGLDGERLLALGEDRFVRVWNWPRGALEGAPFEFRFESLSEATYRSGVALLSSAVVTASEDSVQVVDARTGKPVLPPLLPGARLEGLAASKDRIMIDAPSLEVVDADLDRALESAARLSPAGWKELAAVLSGRTVHEGAAVRLSTTAWLERWETSRRERPDDFDIDLSPKGRLTWHRRRAAALEALLQYDAAAWHIERLGTSANLEDRRRRARVRSHVGAWRFAPEALHWKSAAERRLDPLDRDAMQTIVGAASSAPLVHSRGPYIDLLERYPEQSSLSLAHALRTIVSPERRRVQFLAGSDDTLRVWLNGAEVFSLPELGPAVLDYVRIPVELTAGENVLLVEVGQSGGDWALYFRIEDSDGRRLYLDDSGRLEPLEEGAR